MEPLTPEQIEAAAPKAPEPKPGEPGTEGAAAPTPGAGEEKEEEEGEGEGEGAKGKKPFPVAAEAALDPDALAELEAAIEADDAEMLLELLGMDMRSLWPDAEGNDDHGRGDAPDAKVTLLGEGAVDLSAGKAGVTLSRGDKNEVKGLPVDDSMSVRQGAAEWVFTRRDEKTVVAVGFNRDTEREIGSMKFDPRHLGGDAGELRAAWPDAEGNDDHGRGEGGSFEIAVGRQDRQLKDGKSALAFAVSAKKALAADGWKNVDWNPADDGSDYGAGAEYFYEKKIGGMNHTATLRMREGNRVTLGIYPG